MKASDYAPRNDLRAEIPVSGKAEAWKPGGWRQRIRVEIPTGENVRRIKGGAVDAVWGTGHPDMPSDQIARGLARLARKGSRTAQMREMGGVPVVLSREIPTGMFALRTADRITAYQSETAVPIIAVPYEAAGAPDHSMMKTEAFASV